MAEVDDNHADTLAVINVEVTGRLARLDAAASQVDTKSAWVAGIAATATAFLAGRKDPTPSFVPAVVAYIFYGSAFILAALAYALTRYQDTPDPRTFLDEYAFETKANALADIVATKVLVFENNTKKHKKKVALWWLAVGALAVGIGLGAVAVITATPPPPAQSSTVPPKPAPPPVSAPSATQIAPPSVRPTTNPHR